MATGILLRRPPAQKPPFQPPAYGINHLPPPEPLDPEKFVELGLDLSTRAREHIAKACELFRRLDIFARTNRNNLSNEDVVKILTDLREDAEAELERGFYTFDVATEVLTRIWRHEPSFGEIITREDRERWKNYFHSLRGVLARAYKDIYEMVLATPTCGDLSHIPPQLHFSEPELVMKKRYDRRQGMAVVTGHEGGKEYWRKRLVKGVESGSLPGQVVLRSERTEPIRQRKAGRKAGENPGAETAARRAPAGIVGGTTTYYRIDDNPLDLTRDYNPAALDAHQGKTGQGEEAENTPAAPAQEPYVCSKDPVSGDQTQGSMAKSLQAGDAPGTGRRSSRLQARRESAAAAAAESAPNAPAPTPALAARQIPALSRTRAQASAPKKRKKAAGKGKKGSGRAAKRQRRHSVLFEAEVEQDMSPLTAKELARLPWNNGKPPVSTVGPRKWVPSFPGRRLQGIDVFPHLMAWAQYEDPAVYQGAEPLGEPVNTGVDTRMDDTMDVDMEDTIYMDYDMEEGNQVGMGEMRMSDIPESNEDPSDNESLHNQSRRTSPAPTQPAAETTSAETTGGPASSVASPATETPRGPLPQGSSISKTPFQVQPSTFTPAGTPTFEDGKQIGVLRYEKIDPQRRRNRMFGDYGGQRSLIPSNPPGDKSGTSLKITTSEFLGGDSTRFQSSPPDGESPPWVGDTSEVLGKSSDIPPTRKPAEKTPMRREGSSRFRSIPVGDQPTTTGPLGSGVSGAGPSTHAGVEPSHGWCPGGTPADPIQEEPTLPKLPKPSPPTEAARSTKGLQNRTPYYSGLWTSSDGPEGAASEARKLPSRKSPLGAATENETQEQSNNEAQEPSNDGTKEHSSKAQENSNNETHEHSNVSEEAENTYEEDPAKAQTSAAENRSEQAPTEPSTGASQTPSPSAGNSREEGTTENQSSEYEAEFPSPKPPQAGLSQPQEKPTNPPPRSSGKPASPGGGATQDELEAIARKQQLEDDAALAGSLARILNEGMKQTEVEQALEDSRQTERAGRTAEDDASAQVQTENDEALAWALDGEERAGRGGGREMTEEERQEWARRANLTPCEEEHDGWNERGEPVQEKQWTV